MYENSPEYFKKFQKHFKYNICGTEPKLEHTTLENYAYCYHSYATIIEGCIFGSNHYLVMYEFGSQDDNMFDSLYLPAVIPCLVNCFKLLIQPIQKDFVKRCAIVHDYRLLLKTFEYQLCQSPRNQKQLLATLSEAAAKNN